MINGLTINPEVLQSEHRNRFVATCKFMLGDADSYPTGTIVLESPEQVIALKNMFDHAKWDRHHGYSRDPLYRTFIEMLECEEDEDFFQNDHDAWGYGRFHELSILWYDEQGLPHAVDFWWS